MTTRPRKPSPNPSWKPGDKIESPVSEMIEIDPATIEPRQLYQILISTIVPRPIAFVSTISTKGKGNLAPFSFFNGVSSKPPCIVFSVSVSARGEKGKTKKDTLRNIEETGEFVVNIANRWLIEPLVHSAGAFPAEINELELIGLTPLPSERVVPVRVGESAVQMECKLYRTVAIGDGSPGSAVLVVGEILLIHIAKSVYQNGEILFDKLEPIGRLGGISYGRIAEIFEIPVPRA